MLEKKSKVRLIKDDLNFLKNPSWVVSKKNQAKNEFIKNDIGSYELIINNKDIGLPQRLDKIILYFLLHKIYQNNLNSSELIISRYEIAKNVLNQNDSFSKTKYARIILALERWQNINIRFNGAFYEKDSYCDKYFKIIDIFTLNKEQKKLIIKFNDSYIKQLKETELYKFIDFVEYKKLTSPISLRLYEILIKNFTENVWHIDVKKLGKELTLGKKNYESQIVAAIRPAIKKIEKNTSLKVNFEYIKTLSLCIFKKKT